MLPFDMDPFTLVFLIFLALCVASATYKLPLWRNYPHRRLIVAVLSLTCMWLSLFYTQQQNLLYTSAPTLGNISNDGGTVQQLCSKEAAINTPCAPVTILFRGYPFRLTQQMTVFPPADSSYFAQDTRSSLTGGLPIETVFGDYLAYWLVITLLVSLVAHFTDKDAH